MPGRSGPAQRLPAWSAVPPSPSPGEAAGTGGALPPGPTTGTTGFQINPHMSPVPTLKAPAPAAATPMPRASSTTAASASHSGSAQSLEGGNNGSGSDMEGSMSGNVVGRASFRNILKRSFLGELLFVAGGILIAVGLNNWTFGTSLRRFNPYSFHLTLPLATGVLPGTPLRMKGVPMGSVVSARPLLDRVEVVVEVNEAKTIIPRNAKFELTQSGLIPAANIDIWTPEGVSAEVLSSIAAANLAAAAAGGSREGSAGATAAEGADGSASPSAAAGAGAKAATPSKRGAKKVRLASPKDVAACRLQGVLVCHGDSLDGFRGGSMDELMAHMLKSLRQGETEGNGTVPGRGPVQN
ncbi:hypothetical protein HYH03_006079 [Edaphochlamys debaryana]|uniref:Mce/MlaD domain-containing protein n=1 Tax=Edaphochlamys debaryana TaxID=47281 RepID=A0A835Y4B4_9CHLO|nr:hypothetical protein HYH03_006079 [Edaphochlamys debaryana]|eukprot:KAG2495840.1 hypothetical protein HYH03_006079 [Edaphochlamys debaryana]